MRLAYLADIHGNSIALQAVLAEIDPPRSISFSAAGISLVTGLSRTRSSPCVRAAEDPRNYGQLRRGRGLCAARTAAAPTRIPAMAELGHRSLVWTQQE